MATVAQADTDPLAGAKKIFETVTTDTLVVDNWTASAMTVALELNVDAVKQQLTTTWIAGTANVHTILDCEGTWNTSTSAEDVYYEGLNFNGSSTSKNASVYGEDSSPNGGGRAIGMNLSPSLLFTESTPWDTYEKMALVLTMNGGTTMTTTLVITDNKGGSYSYYGANAGVKHSGSNAFTPNGKIYNVDTDIVNYAAVFDSAKNQTESLAIAQAVLQRVPEPTTGTLSLLALAGLCIRRRK